MMKLWLLGALAGWIIPWNLSPLTGYFLFSFVGIVSALAFAFIRRDLQPLVLVCGILWGGYFAIDSLSSEGLGQPCLALGSLQISAALDGVETSSPSLLGRHLMEVKGRLLQRLSQLGMPLSGIMAMLFLGESICGLYEEVLLFKELGLYHLLVISGSHVSLLAGFLTGILFFPLQLLLALRAIRQRLWRRIIVISRNTVAIAMIGFCYLSGASPPVGRAVLVFCITELGRTFSGVFPIRHHLIMTSCLFLIIFPKSALSSASLMSWLAYLEIIGQSKELRAKPLHVRIKNLLFMQLRLMTYGAAIFGQVTLIGVFMNILVLPLFPVVMLVGAVLTLSAAIVEKPLPLLGEIIMWFFDSCQLLFKFLNNKLDFIHVCEDLILQCSGGLWLLSGIFLLNNLRELSISEE